MPNESAVFIVNEEGKIIYGNYSANKLLKINSKVISDYSIFDFLTTNILDFDTSKTAYFYSEKIEAFEKKSNPLYIDLEIKKISDQNLFQINFFENSNKIKKEKFDSIFIELGRKLSGAVNEKDAALIIFEAAESLIGWDAACLDLYDEKENKIHPVIVIDTIEGKHREFPPAYFNESPSNTSMEVINKGAKLIHRKKENLRFRDLTPFGNEKRPSASMIIVPMRKGNEVKGILSIHSYEFDAYSEYDRDLLQIMADHCAAAIDRIDAEKRLRISDEKYKYLFHSSPIGIFQSTLEGRFITVNEALANILGYTKDELLDLDLGKDIYLDPALRQKTVDHHLLKGAGGEYELLWKKKSGEPIWISLNAYPVQHTTGEFKLFEGFVQDINLKKRAEESLKISEEKYRYLVENINEIIYSLDKDLKIDYMSPSLESLGGYKREELIGMDIRNLIYKEDKYILEKLLRKSYSGKFEPIELRVYHKYGGLKWVRSSNRIKIKDKKFAGISGVLTDITEKKEYDLALKKREEILNAVNFASKYFLRSSDWKDNILLVLKELTNAAGVSRTNIFVAHYPDDETVLVSHTYEFSKDEKFSQNNTSKLQNIDFREIGLNNWMRRLLNREVISGKIKDFPESERNTLAGYGIKSILTIPVFVGNKFWGSINFDDCEKEREWSLLEIDALKTAGDILASAIHRSQFEDELITAKVKAENSDKLKSEFLAQMSHEIRTPLNAIISFSSLIKDDLHHIVSKDLNDSFAIIDRAGKRIIRTIDLILNMAEVQTGTFEFSPENLSITEDILEKIYFDYSQLASGKNLKFTYEHSCSNCIVYADKHSLEQIFSNLIDNAIKYTKKGKVEIFVNEPEDGGLYVDIIDTGIGISQEYLPSLFVPFSQEDQGYTRQYEGNGLGLALIEKYCRINNLQVKVDSKKNSGTTFRIIFPKKLRF